MFIDYVTIMLVNMVAGLFVLALFVLIDLNRDDMRRWSAAFAMVALIALVTGIHTMMTWPLPGPYNMAFGELAVLFGTVFAGAALATGMRWRLDGVTLYAIVAGAVACFIGWRIIDLGLTMRPTISGLGFILAGAGGVFAYPVYRLRRVVALRVLGALVMLAAAGIWAMTGFTAYWSHMKTFGDYRPAAIGAAAQQIQQPAQE